jgi:glycine/serine hydroxymethyltransferase
MGADEMQHIAVLVDAVLRTVDATFDTEYRLDQSFKDTVGEKVKTLCDKFPMC